MARLTITLSDERHRQLKMRAAYRNTSIGALIERALCDADARARDDAFAVVAKARSNAAQTMAGMSDEEIEQWAADEVSTYRRERAGAAGDSARHS